MQAPPPPRPRPPPTQSCCSRRARRSSWSRAGGTWATPSWPLGRSWRTWASQACASRAAREWPSLRSARWAGWGAGGWGDSSCRGQAGALRPEGCGGRRREKRDAACSLQQPAVRARHCSRRASPFQRVAHPERLPMATAPCLPPACRRLPQALLMFGPEYARACGIAALEPLGVFLPGDKNYPGGNLFTPSGLHRCCAGMPLGRRCAGVPVPLPCRCSPALPPLPRFPPSRRLAVRPAQPGG